LLKLSKNGFKLNLSSYEAEGKYLDANDTPGTRGILSAELLGNDCPVCESKPGERKKKLKFEGCSFCAVETALLVRWKSGRSIMDALTRLQ
jgi:hypothetical protein